MLTFLALTLLVSACDSTSTQTTGTRYYEFTSQTERQGEYNFIVKTSDPEVISSMEAQLSKPFDQRNKHINGALARGNDGYNSDWSWHFVPGEWSLADYSTEVCDGNPQFVEDDINYWVDVVGRFCPFSSRVLREVNTSIGG